MREASNESALDLVSMELLRKRRGWFVALGLLLIVLGTVAIVFSAAFTEAFMKVIGWLMVIGGVMQTFHGIFSKNYSGFFVDLLAGILYVVVGIIIAGHPAAVAVALTLLIAFLLVFHGVFRIAVAITSRLRNRSWVALHGVIDVALGMIILVSWRDMGLQLIGMFVGIDMIFNGWALFVLGLAAKSFQREMTEHAMSEHATTEHASAPH
jgi:uncharacterized membrane protein HdeD (DUF308 family)